MRGRDGRVGANSPNCLRFNPRNEHAIVEKDKVPTSYFRNLIGLGDIVDGRRQEHAPIHMASKLWLHS